MKIMLGGVRPLTMRDVQHVDAQRSLLAGKPLGFSCGLLQARGDWAWYRQIFGFPYWSGTMMCWRCKATSDDHMPYCDFSMGAKWRTKRHKPGTCFKAQRLAISTVSPLFTCPAFTLDVVCVGIMRCVDLGSPKRCWATSSVSTWTMGGGGKSYPEKHGVQVCGAN